MAESTRAPWATQPSTTQTPVLPSSMQVTMPPPSSTPPVRSIPGSQMPSGVAAAGVSLTRAPWATSNSNASIDGPILTRAPWAQGLTMPGAAPVDKIDFDVVAKQNPEYQSILNKTTSSPNTTTSTTENTTNTTTAPASSSTTSTQPSPATNQVQYSTPVKVIKTPNYLPLWKQTAAYAELTSFILLLNDKVRGVKVKPEGVPSKKYSITPKVQLVIDWLIASKGVIASIPPIQQSMRYGNKAFRTWHEQRTSVQALQPMLHALLGPDLVARGADQELITYLQDSFGSLQRIDYGTGHELNFVLFLCAVNKLGIFTGQDHIALVLEVFRHYILLMEELQSVYWLEPAGSKGAWGLDDYQFLVFLWGSSQLINSSIQPSDFLNSTVVDAHADSYLFLLGIKFIHKMKSGPFYEHSAYLHQISGLPNWQKANSGLIKMYEEEVLNKFPIVQHITFGRILQFVKYEPGTPLGVSDELAKMQQATKKVVPPVPNFNEGEKKQEEEGTERK